jgi:hypothetical protein
MSSAVEMQAPPSADAPAVAVETVSDRRTDLDVKQKRMAAELQEVGCDGLLVLEPENVAWLTAGATVRGVLDPAEAPGLYFSPEQRWVLCANVDSLRFFDEEVDSLGFLLKEWPWHWGREQLLADLCQGRKIACDRRRDGCTYVGSQLRHLRRKLDWYDQACMLALGQIVSHALEATCRTMNPGETEREIAGQVSHRLMHRGAHPVSISVATDGRSRLYRQHGFTSMTVEKYAVLTACARKYGLCVMASRAVSFGPVDPQFRLEHDTATKVSAGYVAATWPDAMPREILAAGQRIYQVCNFEHEWLLCPQGHVTGRAPVEMPLTPKTEELFEADWAVTWHASAGAGLSCDTFLATEEGPRLMTPVEIWPLKRIRIQGADFVRPDVLQR